MNIHYFLYFDALIFNSVIHLELGGEEGYVVGKKTNSPLPPKMTYLTQYQLLNNPYLTSLVRNATFVIYRFLKHNYLRISQFSCFIDLFVYTPEQNLLTLL